MTNAERTAKFLKDRLLEELDAKTVTDPRDEAAKANLRKHIDRHFIFMAVG